MSQEMHERIWAALPTPAILLDGEDTVVAVNPAAESLLSASARQLEGRKAARYLGEASHILDLVHQAREHEVSVAGHGVEFAWAEAQTRLVDVTAAAADGGDVLVTIQPRSIAEAMDRSLTHRSAARSITGMAAMLAHEIKNPLAGISGAAQLLAMGADEADVELTELIRDETKRIERLLARVESFGDDGPAVREPVNIHDVIDRARRAAQAGYGAHVRFFMEYDPSLPPVPGDSDRMTQIFQNLLKNAAEATPQVGGVVTLRTSYSPGVAMSGPGGRRESLPLLVTITDNGGGVPEELKRDMFEPFVTSKSAGSGLGLALVSKLVADHGGAIECESEPGWTRFRLRFPLWRGPAPDEGAPESADNSSAEAAA